MLIAIRLAAYGVRLMALAGAIVACFALGSARSVEAAAQVEIAGLDCSADPEVVELTNSGDESQNLTGWRLVSDPAEDESYDLTPLGTLAPGASIFIESGPGAEATFTWQATEVFRDGDRDDFVRLVDNSGQTRAQTACAAEAQPTSTPAPTPTTAPPTAAPVTAPADGVPDGGGPPKAVTRALVTPLNAMIAGASLAVLGSAMVAALWLSSSTTVWKRRERAIDVPPPSAPPMTAKGVSLRSQTGSDPLVLALAVALFAAIILVLLAPSSTRAK